MEKPFGAWVLSNKTELGQAMTGSLLRLAEDLEFLNTPVTEERYKSIVEGVKAFKKLLDPLVKENS